MTLFGVNGQIASWGILLAYHMITHTPLVDSIWLLGNGQWTIMAWDMYFYTMYGCQGCTLELCMVFSLIPNFLHTKKQTTTHFSTRNIEKSGVACRRCYLALLLPNLVWLSSLTPLWGAVGRPLLHLPHSHFCLLVQVQLCNWVSSLMSSNVQDCLVREKVIFIKLWNVHH